MNSIKTVLTISFVIFLVYACSTYKKTIQSNINNIDRAVITDTLGKNQDSMLKNLLGQYPQYFDSLLQNNHVWQIQVIYTQIDRNKNNEPVFKQHYYNINPDQYFYPASTVKLPIAVLSLQRLNELKINGLDKNAMMITESGMKGQTPVYNDPSSKNGVPSISHYIKKILLVSDNDAYNRLYEFLGQEYINEQLQRMGYHTAQINHRLSISMTDEQHRTVNPIRFLDSNTTVLYELPLRKSKMVYQKRETFLGKGYYSNGKLVSQPFDFSIKNRLSLPDLHSIVQSLMFPESVPITQRFNLTKDDYSFLQKYMSMLPNETDYPQYDSSYNEAYVKFLLYGALGSTNKNIRIFNKVGDAYGFLIDAAYIADFGNNIEYMLSAVIHCNPDGIYNDDQYEYDKVGFPFMKHLGEVIHRYELERQRTIKPDLTAFRYLYDK